MRPIRPACANWMTRWLRQRRQPAPTPRRPPGEPDPDRPLGCGWFDSSHELHQGLQVDEAPDAQALAQLPLGDWLALQLRAEPAQA